MGAYIRIGPAAFYPRRARRKHPSRPSSGPIGFDVELENAHAPATGFDRRSLASEYVYLRIAPQRIQAWREANELAVRDVMRDGAWLA